MRFATFFIPASLGTLGGGPLRRPSRPLAGRPVMDWPSAWFVEPAAVVWIGARPRDPARHGRRRDGGGGGRRSPCEGARRLAPGGHRDQGSVGRRAELAQGGPLVPGPPPSPVTRRPGARRAGPRADRQRLEAGHGHPLPTAEQGPRRRSRNAQVAPQELRDTSGIVPPFIGKTSNRPSRTGPR